MQVKKKLHYFKGLQDTLFTFNIFTKNEKQKELGLPLYKIKFTVETGEKSS